METEKKILPKSISFDKNQTMHVCENKIIKKVWGGGLPYEGEL